jgi:predicted  nucleic acid-binding Zn-ribbon protein
MILPPEPTLGQEGGESSALADRLGGVAGSAEKEAQKEIADAEAHPLPAADAPIPQEAIDEANAVTADTPGEADEPALTPEEKKELEKLNIALGAIKHDIMQKVGQVNEEDKWVQEVKKIMAAYETKVKRVEMNIKRLRVEVATLYHKKKEIENLKLQKKLEAQLRDAQGDLGTLDGALTHVRTESDKFGKKKQDVQNVIVNLQTQLDKLRGQKSKANLVKEEEKVIDAEENEKAKLDEQLAEDEGTESR